MADISNITVSVEGVDTVCEIKDKVARNDIAINRTTLGYSKKNLFDWEVSNKAQNFYTTVISETDTTISMSSKTKWSRISYKLPTVEIDKSYILSVKISDLDESGGNSTRLILSSGLSGSNVINAVSLANDGVYEIEFSVQENADSVYLMLCPNWSGTTYTDSANSFTVSEIMLRYADIVDATYEPYKESVDTRLTHNKSDIAINKSTLGYQCKNLLKLYYPFGHKYTNSTRTVTWTFNDDYSVSMVANSKISSGVAYQIAEITLKKGTYLYSVEGYSTPNITHTQLYSLNTDGSWKWLANFSAIENKIIVTEETTYSFRAYRNSAVTVGVTETFYPMLRYADILDDTYEPYQPSVQEQITALEARIAALGG